jgi:hypothetical protein
MGATLVGLRCLDHGFCGTIVAYSMLVTDSMSCNSEKIRTLRQQIPHVRVRAGLP